MSDHAEGVRIIGWHENGPCSEQYSDKSRWCPPCLRAALAAADERLAAIESAPESKIEDWLDEYRHAVMYDMAGVVMLDGSIQYSDVPSDRTNAARTWLLNAYRNRGLKLAAAERERDSALVSAHAFMAECNHFRERLEAAEATLAHIGTGAGLACRVAMPGRLPQEGQE